MRPVSKLSSRSFAAKRAQTSLSTLPSVRSKNVQSSLRATTVSLPSPKRNVPKEGTQAPHILSPDSLSLLNSHLSDFISQMQKMGTENRAAIFHETNIIAECTEMGKLFTPFSIEAGRYFSTIVDIEENGTANQFVGNSALKSVFFRMLNKWKEIMQLFDHISENGVSSIADLVMSEFSTLESIIHDITSTNRRQTVHKAALIQCGGNIISILHSLTDGLRYVLDNPHILTSDPSILASHIADIRAFMRVYNEASYNDFPKSGYMHVELSQFKANAMALCNGAIEGVKAAASFDSDISKIRMSSVKVTEMFNDIIHYLKLPSVIIKAANVYVEPSEAVKEDVKETTLEMKKTVKEFIEEAPLAVESNASIVYEAKIDHFIDVISGNLEVEIPKECNIWDRLDILQEEYVKRINSAKEIERSCLLQQETNKSNAETYASYRQEADEEIEALNKEIMQLRTSLQEMEILNDELIKQRNEAIQASRNREKQLFRLRKETDQIKHIKDSERIASKLGKVISGVDQNIHQLAGDDVVSTVDKMSLFVLERRCHKCKLYEQMQKECKDTLKDVIELHPGETILDVVNNLVEKYNESQASKVELNSTISSFEKEIEASKEVSKQIIDFIANRLGMDSIDTSGMSAQEVASLALESFKDLSTKHASEIRNTKDILLYNHRQSLNTIMKVFDSVKLPDKTLEESPISQDITTTQEKTVQAAKNTVRRLVDAEAEAQKSNELLKKVERWMNKDSQYNVEFLPIDQSLQLLMKAIDEAPNPLQKIVDEQESFLKSIHNNAIVGINKLTGILGVDRVNTDILPTVNIVDMLVVLIDKIHDRIESSRDEVDTIQRDLERFRESVETATSKLQKILEHDDIQIQDADTETLLFHLNSFCTELASPGSDSHFVPISEIHTMTESARKALNLSTTGGPQAYLPQICASFMSGITTVAAISRFHPPLQSIFRSFDFKTTSFDPNSESFSLIREQIFQMHTIMGSLTKGELSEKVHSVISNFVSLVSALLSCIAAVSFDKAV